MLISRESRINNPRLAVPRWLNGTVNSSFKLLYRESSDLTITTDDSQLKLRLLSVIFRLEFRNVRFLVRFTLYLFGSTSFFSSSFLAPK